MRLIFTPLVVAVVCVGCKINDVTQKGPPPSITAVTRLSASGSDVPPTFCSTTDGRIHITGTGLTPAPRTILGDHVTVELPVVALECGGTEIVLTGVMYANTDGSLTADVPQGLAAASCDLSITTPTGQTTTSPGAVTVVATCADVELCSSVTPAYGWVSATTAIEICANNANGHGLMATPRAFIEVDPDGDGLGITEVPLIRDAMVDLHIADGGFADASVMTAAVPSATDPRGAGIAVGGPYAIRVVNPDGSEGTIAKAFTVLADPPPHIASISPEQGDTQSSVTITIDGTNFKDPTGSSPHARIQLLHADQASGATCTAPNCYTCGSPTYSDATKVTCVVPAPSMGSGSYVVRYEHTDDGSFSDYAAFAVTNPAGNLAQTTTSMPALQTGRYAHASVSARDDLEQRFIYVIGGQSSATADSALSSIERAPLTHFGDMGAWATLASTLPAQRSGVTVVRQGAYLFAFGGRDTAGHVQGDVWRARVLGSDTAPIIAAPSGAANAASALTAGTYIYRVAAVMQASGDNPSGETLPSDAESIRINVHTGVTVSWTAVSGADHYRIYRTPTADALAGSEALLGESTSTSFIDDGSATVDASTTPRVSGSLGIWVAQTSLTTPRADATTVIGHAPNGDAYVYVIAGTTDSASITTCEMAALTTDGAGVPSLGTFGACTDISGARKEAVASVVSASTSPRVAALGSDYLVIAQGTDGSSVFSDIQIAKIGADGAVGSWTSYTGTPSDKRYGSAGVLVNNVLFSLGGRLSSGGYEGKGITAEVCASGTACGTTDPPNIGWASGDSGITLTTARYRPGLVAEGGLFYFTGGRSNATTVLQTVERGSYQ